MSTIATSAVEDFRTSAIEADGCERKGATLHRLGRWFSNRLYRFFDGLPKSHPDINLEVLKRVPTPI
jgi:hypothetical protein